MMKRGERTRLLLALLLGLLPLAALGAGLYLLVEGWRESAPLPQPTAQAARSTWHEWDRGLATWYDGPTDTMRNGEKLDLAGLTCAVDASVWADLQGKTVRLRRQGRRDDPGILLRVTDSGYLRSAGRFVWDPLGRRYIPSILPGYGQYVVVDIPRETHARLFAGHTTSVVLEVEDEGN
ncbi:MAG TPA: hypothetical protein PLJ35_08185 [Anaerolineae bacterium]|nr:hypothetical protein [Anaerolineae bacterium]HOQ98787.1 hypothetical protein [Anaerolineae bacterium]HPL29148.1 hypothetical protein [Anaerolineae bacterium]